ARIAEAGRLARHRRRRGDVIEAGGRLARDDVAALAIVRRLARQCEGALASFLEALAPRVGHLRAREIGRDMPLEGLAGAFAPHGTDDVERDDVAGAFPDRSEMRIAHEPRIGPFLDVAAAAADLHGVARDLARISTGPVLDQRRHDAGKGP